MTTERIAELATQIKSLAEDPKPGLMTWNLMPGETCQTFADEWNGKKD